MIYVSHRLEEVFLLADRVTVLRDGRRVLSAAAAGLDQDQLIGEMIGREWKGAFPARRAELGPLVLEAAGLGSRGVFQDVCFTLREGEVLGIAGLSGSGKEDLGRALFGAHPVEEGEVRLGGVRLGLCPGNAIRHGLALIPEDRKAEGVIAELSVGRNLCLVVLERLATRLGRLRRRREQELAMTWIKRLGIKTAGPDQTLSALSGGNQQKAALGKWLACQARVIVLSHPSREIDVGVKFELFKLLAELSQSGVGLILISSELEELRGLCHRVLVMREGRVAAELEGESTDAETILRHALGRPAVAAGEAEQSLDR